MRYNNIEKYSWMCDNSVEVIHKQRERTLFEEELCSINTIKDNPKVFENTTSQTDIISKGFFQSEAQDRKSTRLNSSH